MKKAIRWFAIVAISFFPVFAFAQTVHMKALIEELKQGGYVIVFRHGATNRDQADTDPLYFDNIAQQRLLSEKGKEVAKRVGEAFKRLEIPLGRVYTSKFNRAVETGKLLSGLDVTPSLEITEGGLVVTPIENDRRAEALKKMAGTMPESGKNTLIVTHKPNILDAFGKEWFDVKEGEASIFKPDGSGKAVVVARVQAIDWIEAADGNLQSLVQPYFRKGEPELSSCPRQAGLGCPGSEPAMPVSTSGAEQRFPSRPARY